MRYKAVIFDLFGTLVGEAPPQEYGRVRAEMAAILSLPAEDFARLWAETMEARSTGLFDSIQANIAHICRALGASASAPRIDAAARVRVDFTRGLLTPRPDAEETINRLKEKGNKVGLVSNCSPEVPGLWRELSIATLVESPVFSCAVGLRKPDPRIYLLACDRLGVRPKDCLYVGDGASGELDGAAAVGMRPVRIPAPDEEVYRPAHAERWQGPTIPALKDVLPLVG